MGNLDLALASGIWRRSCGSSGECGVFGNCLFTEWGLGLEQFIGVVTRATDGACGAGNVGTMGGRLVAVQVAQ